MALDDVEDDGSVHCSRGGVPPSQDQPLTHSIYISIVGRESCAVSPQVPREAGLCPKFSDAGVKDKTAGMRRGNSQQHGQIHLRDPAPQERIESRRPLRLKRGVSP